MLQKRHLHFEDVGDPSPTYWLTKNKQSLIILSVYIMIMTSKFAEIICFMYFSCLWFGFYSIFLVGCEVFS